MPALRTRPAPPRPAPPPNIAPSGFYTPIFHGSRGGGRCTHRCREIVLLHGLEPWTSRLLAEHSNQLSYESGCAELPNIPGSEPLGSLSLCLSLLSRAMQVNIKSLIRRSGRERCPLQGEDRELAGWVSKCSSTWPANVFPPRAAIVAPTAFVAFGMPRDMQGKAGSPRRTSQAAPHPGTNRALRRSTSEVRGDPVHSAWHGHRRLYAYIGPSRPQPWHAAANPRNPPSVTVAIFAQGTSWADAATQASCPGRADAEMQALAHA